MKKVIKRLSLILAIVLMVTTLVTPALSASAAEIPVMTIKEDSRNMVTVVGETAKLNFYVTKTHEEQQLFFEFYNQDNKLIASSVSGIIYKNGQTGHNHSITVDTSAIPEMVRGAYTLKFYVKYKSNGIWQSTGYGTNNFFVVNKSDFIRDGDADRYFYDGLPCYETKLVKHDGKWYYLDKGLWTNVPTTLLKINGKWFFVEKGMWTAKTGFVKYQGKTFYVSGGKWDSSVNGVKKVGSSYFYIKSGKWSNTTNGLIKSGSTYYHIKSGKWSKTTTLVKKSGKLLYVKSGKWSKTTAIVKYNSKKYYVKNGIAQTSFSGKAKISGKTYTVKKGIIK